MVSNTELTRGCGSRSLQGSAVAGHTGNNGSGVMRSPGQGVFTVEPLSTREAS
jgi:hypothetical protein